MQHGLCLWVLFTNGLGFWLNTLPASEIWHLSRKCLQTAQAVITVVSDGAFAWSIYKNLRSRMQVKLQSLHQTSLRHNRFLVLFGGLHRCSRFPCCIHILRFEICSQVIFRHIWTVISFRESCCRITWWHINNLAADGSGRRASNHGSELSQAL